MIHVFSICESLTELLMTQWTNLNVSYERNGILYNEL